MNDCGCPFISSQNQDAFSLLICGSSFWERGVDQGGASVFILLAQFQFHLMSNHTWNIYQCKSVATKRKSTQTKQKPFGRKCFKWPQIRFQPNFASNMQKIFSATMRKFPLIKSNGTVPHSGVLASLMWLDLGLPRQGYPGLLAGAGRETADAAFLLLVWVVQVLKTSFSPVRFWRMVIGGTLPTRVRSWDPDLAWGSFSPFPIGLTSGPPPYSLSSSRPEFISAPRVPTLSPLGLLPKGRAQYSCSANIC